LRLRRGALRAGVHRAQQVEGGAGPCQQVLTTDQLDTLAERALRELRRLAPFRL